MPDFDIACARARLTESAAPNKPAAFAGLKTQAADQNRLIWCVSA
jgi:hypothetical protein